MPTAQIIRTFSRQRRGTERCQSRAFGFQFRERFKHQQGGSSVRGVGLAQDVFQIPGFAPGNRTGCQKADELAVNASRKILLVLGMQKRIEGDQPAKSRRGPAHVKPAQAKLRRLFLQGGIDTL